MSPLFYSVIGRPLLIASANRYAAMSGRPPGAVHHEEPQPGLRHAVQVRVAVAHQLVRALGRGVQRDRLIDPVLDRERDLDVAAVDRARLAVDQMLEGRAARAGELDLEDHHGTWLLWAQSGRRRERWRTPPGGCTRSRSDGGAPNTPRRSATSSLRRRQIRHGPRGCRGARASAPDRSSR